MTVLLEVHAWKGVARWGDGVWRGMTLGWMTVGWSRQPLLERMRKIVAAMKIIAKPKKT